MPLVLVLLVWWPPEIPIPLVRTAPEVLTLRRPLALVNPAPDEHDLALYEEDEWNRALVCPRDQTIDGDTHLCRYERTGTIAVGALQIWAGATHTSHEWDGMYGYDSEVVLVLPALTAPQVLGTLTQWTQDVVDCHTSLRFRRHQTRDLDRDGRQELCIESVVEEGEGLFHVMDLGDQGKRWRPITRTRTIHAWKLRGGWFQPRMVRVPALDRRCPRKGYTFFTPFQAWDDAVGHRANVQGRGGRLARCPKGPSDSCFNLEACE